MSLRLLPTALLTLALLTTACSKKSAPAHSDHDGHDHSAPAHHAHTAPHGGLLVEIGEHQYNLELVHDRAAGTLTAYTLDAHAENFLRLPLPAIDVVVKPEGTLQLVQLRLAATANAATGETIGDTSQFTAQANFLKTPAALSVTVPTLVIRTHTFTNVTAELPAAK